MTPLTPAVFHILLALAGDKRHGYAISKDVSRQTDGAMHMGPGTLYGTLQRLLNLGWIDVAEGPADADERRRYYRLTGVGRSALETEVDRMASLVRASRARHVVPRPSRS